MDSRHQDKGGIRVKRAIIKFTDGEYCNLPADYMDIDAEWVSIYEDDKLVGIFKLEDLKAAYISDKAKKE